MVANADIHQAMVRIIRTIITNKLGIKNEDIYNEIKTQNQIVSNELKQSAIGTIGHIRMMLEEYGFIDEYIEQSNTQLEQLGLDEFKYTKRNPIPDEQYAFEYDGKGKVKLDKKGNPIYRRVKNAEDIGVVDALSEESLSNLQIGDLILMLAFWESKYLEERMLLSKAMATIKTLGLWDTVLKGDETDIQSLDNSKIEAALKKDLALSYLSREDMKITEKMRMQYQNFLEQEGISSEESLETEVNEVSPEILNLSMATRDVATLEYLIMYLLQIKEIKLREWGILQEEGDKEQEESVGVVIESGNFRGPLLMAISKEALKELFKTDGSNYPVYKKEIDKTYVDIMSKIFLPSNTFFNNLVKSTLKEKPQSKLLANLAGKKALEDR